MALCRCCCSCCFMVSTDASNKSIVKLFPSVACPLPALVTEEIAGFPSVEQFKCGLYCYKFKKALHLLLAKKTGDLFNLFIFFWDWQVIMVAKCNSKACVLILLLKSLSFLVYDFLIIFRCSRTSTVVSVLTFVSSWWENGWDCGRPVTGEGVECGCWGAALLINP